MIVKHLFFSLMERLNGIEEKWSSGTQNSETLREEIMELRKVSDDILDHWLVFEERMAKFHHLLSEESVVDGGVQDTITATMQEEFEMIPDDVAEKILHEIKKMNHQQTSSSQVVSMLSGEAVHIFRKGQGYYSLLMYKEAAEQFAQVLDQDPDLDIARMFLAYSQMMEGNYQEANKHFRLISNTTSHRLILATSLNAEGCICAAQGKQEQALGLFEKSTEVYPKLRDPLFNKALIYMQQGRYSEAKKDWLLLADQDHEDWEVLLQLAKCYQEEGDPVKANRVLEKLIMDDQDVEVLFEAAKRFEDLRQFGNAVLCYRMVLNMDASLAFAWHGLGWNLWHAEGSETSINYIKKAISLSPNHPDYQFSFGWILYQINQLEQAEEVFQHILEQEGFYPLAVAGCIHLRVAREQWDEAEHYCNWLQMEEHASIQALGHLQLGRLWLIQGKFEQAEEQFQRAISLYPDLKDSFLFMGLLFYLKGEKEQALKAWEHTL